MNDALTISRAARGWILPLIVMSLTVYFAYFAIYGKHGLVSWLRLHDMIEVRQAELERVKSEHQALERRVRLLRPDSVDPDLLEEQARARLGLSEPDEVVILRDQH
jgi:cell division protein FtsB